MNARLLRGSDLKALKSSMNAGKDYVEALKKVLTEEGVSWYNQSIETGNYECPNLLAKLADNAGYRRGLQFALSLMKEVQ